MKTYISLIILAIFMSICAYTDIKKEKLLNYVTYSGMTVGIVLNYIFYQKDGLLSSVISILVAFVIFIIPYLIKQMGAGDVKELMMISSIMNIYYCIGVIITGSFLGGLWALYRFFIKKEKYIKVPLGLFLFIGLIVYQTAIILFA